MDSKTSPDLLSAALNQSGLTSCQVEFTDSDGLNIHKNAEAFSNSKNGTPGVTVQPSLKLRSVAPSVSKNVSNTQIERSAVPSTLSSSTHRITNKLSSIPNARVIKLPALKSGSVIKIKTISSSKLLHLNGNVSLSTSKPIPSDTSLLNKSGEVNQSITNGPKLSKLLAGGKAVFIPISKAQVKRIDKHPPTIQKVQPLLPTTIEIERNNNNLVTSMSSSSPRTNISATSSNSSGLNLGSMFIENAEKAVDSHCSTPRCSPFTVLLADENSTQDAENELGLQSKHSGTSAERTIDSKSQKPQISRMPSTPTIRLRMNKSVDQPLSDRIKDDLKTSIPRTSSMPLMKSQGEELVAEDEKEEETHHAYTYAEYMPSKLNIGLPHPDSVVETSSLASITPPDVHYRLSLPKDTIVLGKLSALQLESVVYACQKHESFLPGGERAGFLIGDGAGVGKGRSVAGIIYENYLVGRKRALWFSVSNDLKYDAERDLRDIGAKHIKVYSLNKFKYGKITSKSNGAVKKGVIFATYSSLIGESHSQAKYRTRLKQLLHWCGDDFDGPIIFDECHKAKNLVPSGAGKSTKTGITVLDLQNKLPYARVVYASATGASEPRNMAYMSRLGLWGVGTPFENFMEFIQVVERRGVGAMELVAMDMKLRGSYIARQLSFYGVSFKIEEVKLEPAFVAVYNQAVRLWVTAREAFQVAASMMEAEYHMMKSMWAQFWAAHQRFFKYLCMSAKVKRTVALVREAVKHGKCVVIGLQSTGEAGTVDQLEKSGGQLNDFVSTAKAVFENLIERHFPAPDRHRVTALLGKDFYDEREKESNKRKRPSSDEQSPPSKRTRLSSASSGGWSDSGESDHLSEEEDINKIFGDVTDSDECESPVKKEGKTVEEEEIPDEESPGLLSSLHLVSGTSPSSLPGLGRIEKAQALKKELLSRLERLGSSLPNNMLDELIDALGGTDNVAEMTGRKGRVISTDEGDVQYERRAENDIPVELLNMKEKQRFMDGEKNIAIISEAASSGISLQADKRARNQRKRVHVTVELPWSADRAVQQFGRTHRSNQANAPEYLFLITELAGEQRFASVVAKRLESLGALTHGDRRATESRDLSKYNYDNKYGKKALDKVMKSIAGLDSPLVPPPASYEGEFFQDIRHSLLGVGLLTKETGQVHYQLDKDYVNIFKFMNRILGMEVEKQNALFAFFSDTLNALIAEAKRLGEYDLGIMDVGASNNSVEQVKSRDFPLSGGSMVTLHSVRVERGTSWEDAKRIYSLGSSDGSAGFFIAMQKRNNRCMVMLASDCSSRRHRDLYSIFRPNTGKQNRRETKSEIMKKYTRAGIEEAERWWNEHYRASLDQCSHQYWQGSCSRDTLTSCHVGKRRRMYHVLSGSVLQVWRIVEKVLTRDGGFKYKMQIVRLKTSDSGKLVGLLIPSTCVFELSAALSESANNEPEAPRIEPLASIVVSSDDESEEYEEVDEYDPDHVSSSVLFSKKDFAFS